jgi:hypothetical protein
LHANPICTKLGLSKSFLYSRKWQTSSPPKIISIGCVIAEI